MGDNDSGNSSNDDDTSDSKSCSYLSQHDAQFHAIQKYALNSCPELHRQIDDLDLIEVSFCCCILLQLCKLRTDLDHSELSPRIYFWVHQSQFLVQLAEHEGSLALARHRESEMYEAYSGCPEDEGCARVKRVKS